MPPTHKCHARRTKHDSGRGGFYAEAPAESRNRRSFYDGFMHTCIAAPVRRADLLVL